MDTLEIIQTEEFRECLSKLSAKDKRSIDTRVHRIKEYGHFGDVKDIGEKLLELRWKNGLRVYFARFDQVILLINGGLKNAQKKDIKKARALFRRYAEQ